MNQFKNFKDAIRHFSDEQKCIDFLVQQRWNGCPICPYCNSDKWYSIENGKRFKCANKECRKKYSVTVGTIFHASNIPLTTWFPAIWLISAHKKGISSCQIAKDLGVSQKTGWFMLHRVREALRNKESIFLKNVVEVDELYYQTKSRDKSSLQTDGIYTFKNKSMIVGMLERGGELKLEVAPNTARSNLYSIVHKNIHKTASLMTDGETAYADIGKKYASHESVNHSLKEYVRGDVHTNSIEGAFGLFRRTIIGTYHKLSPKHLSRYCDEMQYRYNSRELKDGQRFEITLNRLETRLSWKQLTKYNGLTAAAIIEPKMPPIKIGRQGVKRSICQLKDGVVMATYQSIVEAAMITGINKVNISKTLRGIQLSGGGFEWKYL